MDNLSDFDSDFSEDEALLTVNSTVYIETKKNAEPARRPIVDAVKLEDARWAITNGKLDCVKRIYDENGLEVDKRLKYNMTGLMCAAYHGHSEIVKFFLEKKANIESRDAELQTSLILLCSQSYRPQGDHLTCAKHLIEHGANINAYDKFNTTPLILAAKAGGIKLVKFLIQSNANLNLKDCYGKTALAFAAIKGYSDILYELIEAKADLSLFTIEGQNLVDLCYYHQQEELGVILNQIIEGETSTNSLKNFKKTEPITTCRTVEHEFEKVEGYLSGVGLLPLGPLFVKNNVQFKDLLSITEEELVKIGVDRLGDRKRILDGLTDLHIARFKASSFVDLKHNKFLMCTDIMRAILNLKAKISYLKATIIFLDRRVQNREIRSNRKFQEDLQHLKSLCQTGHQNVELLTKNLNLLKSTFVKFSQIDEYLLADSIQPPATMYTKLGIFKTALLGGGLVYLLFSLCRPILITKK